MISFRLSTQEYEEFREYCETRGASGSELARAAVNRLIHDSHVSNGSVLEGRVNELEGQLHLLSLELKRFKETTSSQ
jgi:hypothetical protein